ncbi:MAG: 16S rRNA (guanine(966)-N(2))-methyltransferase RsmD [Acholeplasmatales bacterium]|nr:16S rRNA (guanine(966)-N(2))-methyltransferase RsmD [Acholeplasmatales bacterium]
MRIIAGTLRHRIIEMTNLDTTRETQDKVRGAIFNMIGPYIDSECTLDLFTGSGAMAIEAYSRGAKHIVMNDLNKNALECAKKNCKNLGIKDASFYNLDYKEFKNINRHEYDLIILDPPYKMDDIENIIDSVYDILKNNAILVYEMGKESKYPDTYKDMELIKNKEYGIKRVIVYKR